jgi:hypothetical protein
MYAEGQKYSSMYVSYPTLRFYRDTITCSGGSPNNLENITESTACSKPLFEFGTGLSEIPTNASKTILAYPDSFDKVSSSPTRAPTVSDFPDVAIVFPVTHAFSGISKTQYLEKEEENNQALKKTIAVTLEKVKTEDIYIRFIFSGTSSTVSKFETENIVYSNTLEPSIYIQYEIFVPSVITVQLNDAFNAWKILKNQLRRRAATAAFSENLHKNVDALESMFSLYVVIGEYRITSSMPTLRPTVIVIREKPQNDVGMLSGIVIGSVVVFLGVLFYILWHCVLTQEQQVYIIQRTIIRRYFQLDANNVDNTFAEDIEAADTVQLDPTAEIDFSLADIYLDALPSAPTHPILSTHDLHDNEQYILDEEPEQDMDQELEMIEPSAPSSPTERTSLPPQSSPLAEVNDDHQLLSNRLTIQPTAPPLLPTPSAISLSLPLAPSHPLSSSLVSAGSFNTNERAEDVLERDIGTIPVAVCIADPSAPSLSLASPFSPESPHFHSSSGSTRSSRHIIFIDDVRVLDDDHDL